MKSMPSPLSQAEACASRAWAASGIGWHSKKPKAPQRSWAKALCFSSTMAAMRPTGRPS